MRKSVVVLSSVILFFALPAAVIGWLCFGSITRTNLEYYEKLTAQATPMPKLDCLQNYESLDFKYFHQNMLIFCSDVYTLLVQYGQEQYRQEKDALQQRYLFESGLIKDNETGHKETAFSFDSFDFRVLDTDAYYESYDLSYPKNLCFVGTSDENCQIVYIQFLSKDLDYIEGSFADFLKKECNW